MSAKLPVINLNVVVVGQTGKIDLSKMVVSSYPRSPSGPFAHLLLLNESGASLELLPDSGTPHFPLPAGAWNILDIPPGTASVSWQIINILMSSTIGLCYVYYFDTYEDLPRIGSLGNSPVNVNQQIQQRIIAVPTTTVPIVHTYAPSTGTNETLALQLFTLAQIANNQVNFSISSLYAVAEPPAVAPSTLIGHFVLSAVFFDIALAVTAGPVDFMHYWVITENTAGLGVLTTPAFAQFSIPLQQQITNFSGSPNSWALLNRCISATAGMTLDLSIGANVDPGNSGFPGMYGQGNSGGPPLAVY